MSFFASKVTKTVELPDGQSAVVRKLGWKALGDAKGEKQRQSIALMRVYGAEEFRKAQAAAIEDAGGVAEVMKVVAADPFLAYDALTLLQRGITSWTLSKKPTETEIADLDAPIAELLAREIYELSKPVSEAERKND